MRFRERSFAASVAALLVSLPSQAQLFRAYVESSGSDTNPCTLPLPCRLLPAALTAVQSGGEIWMLDSANYNIATVTIGKSVSILAVPGALGSVIAVNGPAIAITADGLQVSLRNLVVEPLPGGSGTNGIQLSGASQVVVEESLFANLPTTGVHVDGAGAVRISETTFRNNAIGVRVYNGATGAIARSRFFNSHSVFAFSDHPGAVSRVQVSDTVASGGSNGFQASADGAGAGAFIYLVRTSVGNMTFGVGVNASNGATADIVLDGTAITNNNVGWGLIGAGATIRTMGNNLILDNVSNGPGALTPTSLQ